MPSVIELPLVRDELIGKVAFAYPGSNPSFEIKLPFIPVNFKVVSVHVEDITKKVFLNLPFKITPTSDNFEKFVLSVILPDDIPAGESTLIVNLDDSSSLTGTIQIVNFKNVDILTNNETLRTTLDKPKINKVFIRSNNEKYDLVLKGESFATRKIVFKENGLEHFIINEKDPDPNTSITLFPSDLNTQITFSRVLEEGKFMRIQFKLKQRIKDKTKVVLVLATPRGIVSRTFLLNP